MEWMSLYAPSSEILSLILAVASCSILLLCFRFGGAFGLISFMTLSYIASNIQVLHMAQFSFLKEPVAQGTWLFALTYLISDILTEHYGPHLARRAVLLSFLTQIGFTVFMMLCVWHPPLPDTPGNTDIHTAMTTLFMPSLRIMVASLASYGLSQLLDIWIFQKISTLTQGRYVWLRTSVSSCLAAFLDNVIFSTLAWVLLSPTPVSWRSLIVTYILGTYIARIIVSCASIPMMYISYRLRPVGL